MSSLVYGWVCALVCVCWWMCACRGGCVNVCLSVSACCLCICARHPSSCPSVCLLLKATHLTRTTPRHSTLRPPSSSIPFDCPLLDFAQVHKLHPWLSLADLYVLAGYVAIEESGGPKIPFSYGRRDFTEQEAEAVYGPGKCPFALRDGENNPHKSRLPVRVSLSVRSGRRRREGSINTTP